MEGMFFPPLALTSPRASANLPLVRHGAAAAYSRGEVITRDGKIQVEVEIPLQGASRVQVNRNPVRRKRDLRRQVRAVFFGPDDLDVVRGEPSHRRRFLDEAVVALWPLKESVLTRVTNGSCVSGTGCSRSGTAVGRPRRGSTPGTSSWSRPGRR